MKNDLEFLTEGGKKTDKEAMRFIAKLENLKKDLRNLATEKKISELKSLLGGFLVRSSLKRAQKEIKKIIPKKK